MKVLFVLENYIPHIGGVETVFKNLTENLAKQGHDIAIITHQLKNTRRYEVIKGVKIHRIPCLDNRYLFSFLAIKKTLKLAKQADIIHTTTYNGALPAIIAAKKLKKPCIITVHEILGDHWKTFTGMTWSSAKLHKYIEKRITKRKFDYFIAVSESTKKQLIKAGVKESKIRVIYNGVDYEHFNPKKYNRRLIRKKLGLESFIYLSYGRPGITKGIEYLIQAVPLISKKIPNSKLLLILSKSPKDRYLYMKALIEKLNIKDKVLIHDPVGYKELPKYIQAADCIVVPSLTEGFGYTAAEACAMDIPVVSTNTTSLPEVCSGKYVLIQPRNPKAIAAGIELIYNKKYKKSKLKKFTIANNVKNYLKLYKELLKK